MAGEPFALAGVHLWWSVLKLKQVICERRSSGSPELLRLLVKNTPMDDETALLSAHGLAGGATVNMISQTAADAAKHRVEFAAKVGMARRRREQDMSGGGCASERSRESRHDCRGHATEGG